MTGSRQLRIPPCAFLRVDATGPLVRRLCVVAYNGAEFCGSQAQDQPGPLRTVQETIEDALRRTTGESELPRLRFASRTDTGVHARGQVVMFASQCVEEDRVFRDALNTRLPDDVLCRSLVTLTEEEATAFDPRTDATYKCYEYEVVAGGLRPVTHRRNVWYVRKSLDVAKMQTAIDHLLAPPTTKDFSSFTPQKADGERDNMCTVSKIELHCERLDDRADTQYEEDVSTKVRLVFEGNRFRYKMIRTLVGTIVDVGLGRLKPDDIPMILAAKNRGKAGQGAPPHGLTLVWIKYDMQFKSVH
ncbi:tRNA pseudouridine synthase A 1 [Phytophthora citrophthora]|uniref:tRNA pseudouridine synthase n=1 Tax=Phytophthora citrophthora TaxID=4793 RepID=A0AAD9G167_9STRA|nr:tRNA pseudouridine synthase A 1 [Phytophthora citrophthora]